MGHLIENIDNKVTWDNAYLDRVS